MAKIINGIKRFQIGDNVHYPKLNKTGFIINSSRLKSELWNSREVFEYHVRFIDCNLWISGDNLEIIE